MVRAIGFFFLFAVVFSFNLWMLLFNPSRGITDAEHSRTAYNTTCETDYQLLHRKSISQTPGEYIYRDRLDLPHAALSELAVRKRWNSTWPGNPLLATVEAAPLSVLVLYQSASTVPRFIQLVFPLKQPTKQCHLAAIKANSSATTVVGKRNA